MALGGYHASCVALDDKGDVYFSDRRKNVIRKIIARDETCVFIPSRFDILQQKKKKKSEIWIG
jgi:hypothetical protein